MVPWREVVKLTWGCLFVLTLGLLPFNAVKAQEQKSCAKISFTLGDNDVDWSISADPCGIKDLFVTCQNCSGGVVAINQPCKTSEAGRVTKEDGEKPSTITVLVGTCDGLVAEADPVFTTLKLTTGLSVRQTFTNIPDQEHYITVTNGAPGLAKLTIRINGRRYASPRLASNETRNLDAFSAMEPGDHNTVTLTGVGELGASADVSILDLAPAPVPQAGRRPPARSVNAGGNHLDKGVWGPLAEEIEETSDLHFADVSTQTIQIVFKGAVEKAAAENRAQYAVEVNGTTEPVVAKNAKQSAEGVNVTLQLSAATLKAGDKVDVQWVELTDTKGRPLSGHVSLIAQ